MPLPLDKFLLQAFRHQAWATRELIRACQDLPGERLQHPVRGYGSLHATLAHTIACDAHYLALLGGERPEWADPDADPDPLPSLSELDERVVRTLSRWEERLALGIDLESGLQLDQGAYRCRASVVLLQALHHGTAHREQVRGALQELLGEAPDLQPWVGALALGLAERSDWSHDC